VVLAWQRSPRSPATPSKHPVGCPRVPPSGEPGHFLLPPGESAPSRKTQPPKLDPVQATRL